MSNKTPLYMPFPFFLAILLIGMHLDDTTSVIQKFAWSGLFSRTLFATAKYWKTILGDWVNILWYKHTVENVQL